MFLKLILKICLPRDMPPRGGGGGGGIAQFGLVVWTKGSPDICKLQTYNMKTTSHTSAGVDPGFRKGGAH